MPSAHARAQFYDVLSSTAADIQDRIEQGQPIDSGLPPGERWSWGQGAGSGVCACVRVKGVQGFRAYVSKGLQCLSDGTCLSVSLSLSLCVCVCVCVCPPPFFLSRLLYMPPDLSDRLQQLQDITEHELGLKKRKP